MKKRKLFITLLILTVIVIFGYLIYVKIVEQKANKEMKFMPVYVSDRASSKAEEIVVIDDSLYLATLEGIEKVDKDGIGSWSKAYHFNELLLISEGTYIATVDITGKQAYIFDEAGLKGEVTTGSEIVYGAINGSGDLALILDNDDEQIIAIYDKNGNKKAERFTTFAESGYPVFISISGENGKAVSSHITLKNNKVDSVVTFFDFSSEGKNLGDRIFGHKNFEDSVISTGFFLDSEKIALVGDNAIHFYEFGYELEELAVIEFETKPNAIYKFGDKIVVSYGSSKAGEDVGDKVVVYTKRGGIAAQIPNKEKMRVDVDDRNIYFIQNDKIKSYKGNKEEWSGTFSKNVNSIKRIGKDYFVVVYDNNFEVLKKNDL